MRVIIFASNAELTLRGCRCAGEMLRRPEAATKLTTLGSFWSPGPQPEYSSEWAAPLTRGNKVSSRNKQALGETASNGDDARKTQNDK